MTVRAVEGKNPYTGGIGIEITEDKVINLRLRGENNLIEYDEGDNEIYVDLQLDDEITPTDELPVGITTGRIIVDNGWDFTGTIIVAKTTSGDLIKFVYADDGKFYIDNGTGTFKQIYLKSDIDTLINALKVEIKAYVDEHDTVVSDTAPSDAYQGQLWYDTTTNKLKTYDGTQWNEIAGGASYTAGSGINIDANNEISVDTTVVATQTDVNTKTFTLSGTGSSATVLAEAQEIYDWYSDGKNPIVIYDNKVYTVYYGGSGGVFLSRSGAYNIYASSTGYGETQIAILCVNGEATGVNMYYSYLNLLVTNEDYQTPYTPIYDGSPATKKYVDDSVTVVSGDAGVTYIIKKSTTPPPAGTPSNVLTFVG